MIYLLAKYALLFLLATVLGFVLGYWWSRRNFVDVSESYEDLRKATERTDAANWEQLWKRINALSAPQETDFSPVFQRLDGVQKAVAGIPKPPTVDLAPVESRLESLAGKVDSIPYPLTPKAPDITPVMDRIGKLETAVRAIPAPADIGPLSQRLADLETAVRDIPQKVPQKEVDLRPVQGELSALREQIVGLPKVETHEPADLAPLLRRLDTLEKTVSRIPQPEKVDLKPIDGRLRGIETEIGRLGKRLSAPVRPEATARPRAAAQPKRQSDGPRILSAALYGKKDDLKRISGVGPKLERMLNANGVFYFWQVASWSRNDIDIIDKRLDAFKGRISRDDWVSQAKELKRSPGAASMPAE